MGPGTAGCQPVVGPAAAGVWSADLAKLRRSGFEAIDPVESKVRVYSTDTAIIVGRTEMRFRSGESSFTFSSRYTHVFVLQDGGWQLASAQGTQIR